MENLKNLDLKDLIDVHFETRLLINHEKNKILKKELADVINNYYPEAKDYKYLKLVNMMDVDHDPGERSIEISFEGPEDYTLTINMEENCEMNVFQDIKKIHDNTSIYLRGFGEFLCGKKIQTVNNFAEDIYSLLHNIEETNFNDWEHFKKKRNPIIPIMDIKNYSKKT